MSKLPRRKLKAENMRSHATNDQAKDRRHGKGRALEKNKRKNWWGK